MTTAHAVAPQTSASRLRRLYLARFAFVLVWAAAFAASASPLGAVGFALAVAYPLVDVVALLVDAREASATGRPTRVLHLNVAFSLAAAVALLAVGKDDVADILVVWGVWAIASGATQLAVGIARRAELRGQGPMMASGAISVLAGASFAATAQDATSATGIAGYATLGGIFFLVAALRLGRRSAASVEGGPRA
ncbi:hypothetical protein [Nocardioides sp.]|uniref:hypothetical protein n=1 Tax=Nocardioides sp. TaxID=35761 RepID=UPI0035ADA464